MTLSTADATGEGYDVIGDVHGHVEQLVALLRQLGYVERDGLASPGTNGRVRRRHHRPEAGPQFDTLRLVRKMVDAGSAKIVLGNHEFNAVAYATVDPARWDYCRAHSRRTTSSTGVPRRSSVSTPRSTGRCSTGSGRSRCGSTSTGSGSCTPAGANRHRTSPRRPRRRRHAQRAGRHRRNHEGHRTYTRSRTSSKAPRFTWTVTGTSTKAGTKRSKARVAWWREDAITLRDGAVIPDGTQLHDPDGNPVDSLPSTALPDNVPRYTDEPPVIFGHYWRSGALRIEGPKTACVDYSAGNGGPLVAYRWSSGQAHLDDAHLRTA